MDNLRKNIVDEIHRNVRRNFARRRVIVKAFDDTWQIDLIEMPHDIKVNRNHKYLLTVIDVFSKFAWAKPLTKKTGKFVSQAMEEIFQSSGRTPQKLQSDEGGEFFNKIFKALMLKYKIHHYSTFSNLKVFKKSFCVKKYL